MPAPASDPSVMRAILAAEDAEPIVRLAAALIWLRITDARVGGLHAGRLAREARDWLLRDGPDWLEYLTGDRDDPARVMGRILADECWFGAPERATLDAWRAHDSQ